MKIKLALIPATLIAGFAGYVTFHPGVAYAEPRLAAGKTTPFAQSASYSIDPMHTSIYFDIQHMGLSHVHGRITKFSGKVVEDAADLTKSSVEFTAQLESIDTAVAPRDAHLRTADFFDVAKYPELSFRSTKVSKSKGGYTVQGDLTIKGVTKSISIPFKHYGPLKGSGEQPDKIGVVAEPIKLKRSDFGVGAVAKLPNGDLAIGDEVTIRLSLEAGKDK